MDLTSKEKSTWGLLLGIVVVSVYYFPQAIDAVDSAAGSWRLIGLSIAGVIALVVIEIIYHVIIAAVSPREAGEDERDKLIDLKAERLAGFVLGFILFWIVGRIIATTAMPELGEPSVLMVAVWILAALTASEVVKLLAVIGYYRVGN